MKYNSLQYYTNNRKLFYSLKNNSTCFSKKYWFAEKRSECVLKTKNENFCSFPKQEIWSEIFHPDRAEIYLQLWAESIWAGWYVFSANTSRIRSGYYEPSRAELTHILNYREHIMNQRYGLCLANRSNRLNR